MKHNYFRLLSIVVLSIFLAACAGPKARTMPERTYDLLSKAGVQKTDAFLVLLDASASTSGKSNLISARDTISDMNQMLPETMKLNSGLRIIGNTMNPFKKRTELIYGMTEHSKKDFENVLQSVSYSGGKTPMAQAISACGSDLKDEKGNIALIVCSDGVADKNAVLEAAEQVKGQFEEGRLCIYSVLIGNDSKGKELMEQLALKTPCGFATNVDKLGSDEDMAEFIKKVFFTNTDSDKDGILDILDQCPDTPSGVEVDLDGCPLKKEVKPPMYPDSDGDGVYDHLDKCPGTPKGAKANTLGCWTVHAIYFDLNEYTIKSKYCLYLDEIASVFVKNKNLRAKIQGHTDNTGDADLNQILSENRAKAVMQYLINKGVSKEQLFIKGFGFSKPCFSNETMKNRAKNRRVEFQF
ncbi:OmpA-OmpF porin, OOP family [Candidatus Magnetomoraceae bacterium gMMP-15]